MNRNTANRNTAADCMPAVVLYHNGGADDIAAYIDITHNIPAAAAVAHTAAIAAGNRFGTAAIAFSAAAETLTTPTARAAADAAAACRAVEHTARAAARALYVFNDYEGFITARAALLSETLTARAAADIFAIMYAVADFDASAAAALFLYDDAAAAAEELDVNASLLFIYWNTANN